MIGRTLGHYRIVEKIAVGGMGEVYRAHDEQLDRDVALKVLPTGALIDEVARKRFRKEALALAKLNHPNIETVFELGSQNGLDFLVMELIRGATLGEKLANGPLGEKELLRLGAQLAEGLAAAHAQGVVHRDLKPSNLLITPDGRLKILDFGLAKLLQPAAEVGVTQSLTDTQSVCGTPPYMSPEQLRGEAVDARSDIYSAGAILYEMTTGRRPFPQTQGPKLIGAILHETPPSPCALNPRVPPALEKVILKALDKKPTQRYQSAKELLAALEGLSASTPLATALPHILAYRWLLALGGALTLVLAVVVTLVGFDVGGWRERLLGRANPRKEGAGLSTAHIKARRSVAVLGFKNLSGRSDKTWLSTALSEMLTTELAVGGKLRTIPGENVAQMKISLALPEADSYGKETLSRIRKNLGTDDVVLGSYLALGNGQVRLDLKLEDAMTGEIVDSVAETGKEEEVADLVSRTGAGLREKLGAGEVSRAEMAEVRASLPSNAEAARMYSEGLAKLRLLDNLRARDLVERAVTAEPNFALAHSALAAAWSGLGYDDKAKQEAKTAFDLSARLSPVIISWPEREKRLSVEGRYRETTHEWIKAAEIYRTLWDFFPDNLDYGLRLGRAQTSAGKGKDALATLEALRKLPAPTRDDPQIDLFEAQAAHSLGDFKRGQEAAARAVRKGKAIEARLVVAGGQLLEGRALAALGEPSKARIAYEEARQIYAAAGDRTGAARVLNNMAILLSDQGDLAGAKAMYEQSLVIFREVGNRFAVAALLNNIGNVLDKQGDLDRARKMHEEALAIRREIDNKSGMAQSLLNIGNILTSTGDLEGAKKSYQESAAIDREIGDRSQISFALHNLAGVLAAQGDLAGAKKTFEQALAMRREMGDKSGTAYTLSNLGEVLSSQGDLVTARQTIEEALAIRKQLGEKGNAAQSELSLASLAIEEGHPAEAEMPARRAVEEYRTEPAADAEAKARVVLADSLLAQNQPGKAQEAIDRAIELAKKSQDRTVRFSVDIISARVRAALGKPVEGMTILQATLAEAKRYRFLGYQFDTRLALGKIEMKSGKVTAGRTHLETLERDATAKGFHLLAQKAAAASR